MAFVTGVILAISLVGLRQTTAANIVAIAIAAFVAVIVSRRDIRIYRTSVRVLPKDIFAFWAIVWLG
ncbi:MAG TPA: hypothetical protein VLI65_00460, partial [Pyrinomonadaceae bacterium]|nr:hypothetical protein [Pyrinomonadaceae bacterium]